MKRELEFELKGPVCHRVHIKKDVIQPFLWTLHKLYSTGGKGMKYQQHISSESEKKELLRSDTLENERGRFFLQIVPTEAFCP